MSKQFSRFMLILLFTCNSLLGSTGAIVICLHSENEWHFDADSEHDCHRGEHEHSQKSANALESPELEDHNCKHLKVKGQDLVQNRPSLAELRLPTLQLCEISIPVYTFKEEFLSDIFAYPAKAPPELSAMSTLVASTTVYLI